jgi:hypothetical protein
MFKSAFMNGFARGIDLGSTMSRRVSKKLQSKSDNEMLAEDWNAIGNDLKSAMEIYGNDKTAVTK